MKRRGFLKWLGIGTGVVAGAKALESGQRDWDVAPSVPEFSPLKKADAVGAPVKDGPIMLDDPGLMITSAGLLGASCYVTYNERQYSPYHRQPGEDEA